MYTLHIDIFSGDRLKNIEVTVGFDHNKMKNCCNFKGPGKTGQVIMLACKTPIAGRYVTILKRGTWHLSLAEVQVLGYTGKHLKIYLNIYLVVCFLIHVVM